MFGRGPHSRHPCAELHLDAQIPKARKGNSIANTIHYYQIREGSKTLWCETKYDGERCASIELEEDPSGGSLIPVRLPECKSTSTTSSTLGSSPSRDGIAPLTDFRRIRESLARLRLRLRTL